MEDYQVILKPLITEQGMHLASAKSAYSFEVHKKANKAQIRNAIERLYSIKVEKVRTANRIGKARRRGRNFGVTARELLVLYQNLHI